MRPDSPELTPDRSTAVGAIEMMLDCAMVAGAELRLPLFVFLVRMARLELMSNLESARGGKGDSSAAIPDQRPKLG